MQFLLVHGGWQGGWCWDGVVAELERRGHGALAPTLPGLEPDCPDRSIVGLSCMIRHVARQVVDSAMSDVVLVGHSGGGPVIQGVAEAVGERVRQLTFMSATVLLDGESILDLRDAGRAVAYAKAAAASPDGGIPLAEDVWIHQLCHDVSEETARAWLPKVVSCPFGWLREPASLPASRWREISSAYIFLQDERPSAQALYRKMAARLREPRIDHCPGAHQAMLTQPVGVAEALLRVAGAA